MWVGLPDGEPFLHGPFEAERVIEENPTEDAMPQMKSLQRHEYGGRFYDPDEVFNCDPAHVQLLSTIGRAELVDMAEHSTRAMESAQATPVSHRNQRHQRRTS